MRVIQAEYRDAAPQLLRLTGGSGHRYANTSQGTGSYRTEAREGDAVASEQVFGQAYGLYVS